MGGKYIGSSIVSIEPDNSIFSLALAGYGAPGAGRFSLTWNVIDDILQITAITAVNGKLYAATDDNELLEGIFKNEKIKWKKAGAAHRIISMASYREEIFAMNSNGQLLKGIFSQGEILWDVIQENSQIKSITVFNESLYGINSHDELLACVLSQKDISWHKVAVLKHLVSMTSDSRNIYALDANNIIWSAKPDEPMTWMQIGRHNSFTFDVQLNHILAFNNKFYAISKDNKIYIASHSSKKDLAVRSLAIKNESQTIVIVGVDVTGFNYSFINEIKNEIFQRRNIPASAILINASHTHFAPVTQRWSSWQEFYHCGDSHYLNFLKNAIITSIEIALDEMCPKVMYFARGTTSIGVNRRSDVNSAAFYDNTLDVIKIQNVHEQVQNVLFITGCHPVFKNSEDNSPFTLSANFPGVAGEWIRKKIGVDPIFLQGFAGDINPKDDNYEDTGKELAEDILHILKGKMEKIEGEISCSLDTIQIPIKPWTIEEILEFRDFNALEVEKEKRITSAYTPMGQFVLTPLLEREKNVRWANLMLDDYKKGTIPLSFPVYVQIINIGHWKLIGMSREVVAEYGPAIRNIWPDQVVSVASYCNDVSSYLPVDWHINSKTYEGYDSFFWYSQPAIPPVNVRDIVINQIRDLKINDL